MSYATEQAAPSRTPCSLVIITLDFCSLVYGVGACTASGAAGSECYNTFPTCQVKTAYVKTTKDYKFTNHEAPLPFSTGERPYVKSISYLPTEIKDTLTVKGRCTTEMTDEPDTDVGFDPYVSTRASVQGTFWKKFLARNTNYRGRRIAVYDGFVGVSEADFILYGPRFVGGLENITISRGAVKIEAADLLKSLDDVEIPAKLNLKLATDITIAATSITLAGTDLSSMDSPSGYIRVDDEIIYYAAINTTTKIISSCTRAMFGTTAAEHNANAKVQLCKYYAAMSPFRTMCQIMDDAGVLEDDINVCAYVVAHDFGEAMNVSAIITEPEKASTLYWELVDLMGCKSWVAEDQRITIARTVPNHPDRTYSEITDEQSILERSGSVDLNRESLITRGTIYWDLDPIGKPGEQTDYRRVNIAVDADAEGVNEQNQIAEKKIMTRWVSTGTLGETSSSAGSCRQGDPVSYGDMLLDGSLEMWSDATTLKLWTTVGLGSSSVNQEFTNFRHGAFCARMDIDESNSTAQIYRIFQPVQNTEYTLSFYQYASAASKTMKYKVEIYLDDFTTYYYLEAAGTWTVDETWLTVPYSPSFAQTSKTFTTPDENYICAGTVYFQNDSAASSSIYIDEITITPTGGLVSLVQDYDFSLFDPADSAYWFSQTEGASAVQAAAGKALLVIDADNNFAGLGNGNACGEVESYTLTSYKYSFLHSETGTGTMKYEIYAAGEWLQADGSWLAVLHFFTVAHAAIETLVEKTFTTPPPDPSNYVSPYIFFRNDSAASCTITLDDVILELVV